MGSPIEIRQMMAEGKLPVAQFEIEASLKIAHGEERRELLFLLLDLLKLEIKNLPVGPLLEAAELAFTELRESFHAALPLLKSDPRLLNLLRFQLLIIRDYEERGKLEEVLIALNTYQIHCVEKRIPYLDIRIQEFSKKYFRHEFSLSLQRISLALMLKDKKTVTDEIRELLFVIHESRSRNASQKIRALLELLESFELQGEEILYRNFCYLWIKGISGKKDLKTVLELAIGFEDFRMLVLVLDLASTSLPETAIAKFVHVLKSAPDFDFLYLEKNFPKLKKHFISSDDVQPFDEHVETVSLTAQDLVLGNDVSEVTQTRSDLVSPMEDEEVNLLKQIQYGDFSFSALCDLTVSFLQSDYLRAARSAIFKAGDLASTSEERMQALYLRITVLMKLRDFRSALDNSLRAMDLVHTEADLLSLLYVQAECYEKLHERGEAIKILHRILEIDKDYRLAKERLEKLNEA